MGRRSLKPVLYLFSFMAGNLSPVRSVRTDG